MKADQRAWNGWTGASRGAIAKEDRRFSFGSRGRLSERKVLPTRASQSDDLCLRSEASRVESLDAHLGFCRARTRRRDLHVSSEHRISFASRRADFGDLNPLSHGDSSDHLSSSTSSYPWR